MSETVQKSNIRRSYPPPYQGGFRGLGFPPA